MADVGTDHAYIPIFLIKSGKIRSAVAADINLGPTRRAEENIKGHGLSGKIQTILSDGLDNVADDAYDTVIIAGMGGMLISEIIERSRRKRDALFILQPMTAIPRLRFYLYSQGFEIVDEQLCREGNKIYTVIVAKHGKDLNFDAVDLYIGRKLIEKNDPLLPDLIERQAGKISTKIRGLSQGKHTDENLTQYYKGILEAIQKIF